MEKIEYIRMKTKIKNLLAVSVISLFPTLLLWLPFFFRAKSFWTIPLPQQGLATIVANYDGPLFLVVAKTLYNPGLIKSMFAFDLPTEYYAAHFPAYPLLVRLFGTVTGYPYALLGVTLATSVLAIFFFQKYIRLYVNEKNSWWLTVVFAILPARWFIVRSVGSAEPLFMAAIIASVYYYKNKKFMAAALWGVAAQLTKSPGILLFIAFGLDMFYPKLKKIMSSSLLKLPDLLKVKNFLPFLLIPASLLLLFVGYGFVYGDFFAYFNSGDNIHLFFPPFQIFNYSAPWVGTFWLEEVILVYLLISLGLAKLINQKKAVEAWFVGIFFVSVLFVSHRDVIRYSLPVVPFLIAAWSGYMKKMEFKIALAVITIPIYLFSLAYISQNVMPISDWAPFL